MTGEHDLLQHRDQPTELSARSLGWLRYLHRKAHTPDDWDRDGRPHPHWDNRSDPPMASWHRFDLVDSSYAIGLMAHRTPAWTRAVRRDPRSADRAAHRLVVGRRLAHPVRPRPRSGQLPRRLPAVHPARAVGDYDVPGWTANGIEPWGVQMDPIAADGMLFYKGFLLVLLGIRVDDRPTTGGTEPFEMIRDGEHTFTWSHAAIADTSEPAVDGGADRLPLREHQDLAVLTGRRGPRSEAPRQPIRHRLPSAGVRPVVGSTRGSTTSISPVSGAPTDDDLLLRPDHRRAPSTAGAGGVVQLLLFVGAGAGRRTPAV